ncbi:cupin domain-containing protein [Aureibaculum sp. 2210JD6-5]|uniref:cupin domain-containing protein n=1 Tax=Aureibaculum sp. 2210JD6-5 TaxID=3103957 RepID=UPI002AAE993A|nr:cupin domain-containing protein [Aureibaculum sp. 2210JD6-5]MDY7395067.1 cupin domain-containing protein [Aureibaculum sp. 2210JD6-5]
MNKGKSNKSYFGLKFIATGNETGGKYFLSETIIPSGDSGPPIHSHSKEDESFFVQSGKLTFNVNGKEFELNKGEFLNIEKGEKHTWRNDSDKDAVVLVTFAPAGIENMFVELDEDISKIKEVGLKFGTEFEL